MARAESLRLADFSDRDLLGVMADLADSEGWVMTSEVAERVFGRGINSDAKRRLHAIRCVAIRLSWMRRFGVVQLHREEPGVWGLSAEGVAMLRGELRSGQAKAIDGAMDEQLLHLATAIADRYRAAGQVGATMMRRAWQHGEARRRR